MHDRRLRLHRSGLGLRLALGLGILLGAVGCGGDSATSPVAAESPTPMEPPAPTTPPPVETPQPAPTPPPLELNDVRLIRLRGGFDDPVAVVGAPDSDRLFIVEQRGRILVLEAPSGSGSDVFLDLTDVVRFGGELGLLGLAFPPDFATSGVFYVNYTDEELVSITSEFSVEPTNPRRAIRESERVLLRVPQDTINHHGGALAFGPDGALYLSLGDSAQGADPNDYAQNPAEARGKILRFDPGLLPSPLPDNPGFENPHVLHLGLRNPWRFSFDRETGDLYIGDVGELEAEEIDVAPAGAAGLNFGWRDMEGDQCFLAPWSEEPRPLCDASGFAPPVFAYGRDVGCSVIGGFVYRGPSADPLVGRYVFADWCTNRILSFVWRDGEAEDLVELTPTLGIDDAFAFPSSFGEDRAGNLYVVTLSGGLYRFQTR